MNTAGALGGRSAAQVEINATLGAASIAACVAVGLAVGMGAGLPILGALVGGGLLLAALPTAWAPAVGLIPVVLIPAPAMAITHVGPLPLGPVMAAAFLAYAIAAYRQRRGTVRINRRLAGGIAVLGLFGVLGSVIADASTLQAALVLSAVWAAGALVGVVAAGEARAIPPIVILGLFAAGVAGVETVQGTHIWEAVTGANRFGFTGAVERARATFGHPLVASTVFVTLALLAFQGSFRGSKLAALLLVGGSLLTVSRSAVLGITVGVLVLVLQARGWSDRAGRLVALAGAGVVVTLILAQSQYLKQEFGDRISATSTVTEQARVSALTKISSDLSDNPARLAIGEGLRSSTDELRAAGGNAGLNTYDNQYITLAYDVGLLGLMLAGFLVVQALVQSRGPRPELSRRVAAPLAGAAAMFLVFDGLYWFATGALFWALLGFATAHVTPRAHEEGLRRSVVGSPS